MNECMIGKRKEWNRLMKEKKLDQMEEGANMQGSGSGKAVSSTKTPDVMLGEDVILSRMLILLQCSYNNTE